MLLNQKGCKSCLVEQMRRRMGKEESYPSSPLTSLDVRERDKALALIKPLGLNLEKGQDNLEGRSWGEYIRPCY